MKKVYITGASGLLGSELVYQLLQRTDVSHIVCLIRDYTPKSRFFADGMNKQVIVVQGDLRNVSIHERVLSEYDIDTVFHLAAQPLVQVALKNPFETMEVNIRGTYSLLEAIRRQPSVKATLIASSDKAYGMIGDRERYDEQFPLQGRYPYDVSKSCTDLLSRSYAETYGMNVGITRCGNFFGPGDLNGSRIIPTIINAYLKNEAPIIRSDGKQVRDYLYVADGVDAYIQLADYMHKNHLCGEAFNFSYGLKLSVIDVIERVQKHLGSTLKPDIRNEAKAEIPIQSLDSSKAKKVLKWKPKYGFEQGLAETIKWYQKASSPTSKAA